MKLLLIVENLNTLGKYSIKRSRMITQLKIKLGTPFITSKTTFGKILQKSKQNKLMIVSLELHTGQFINNRLLDLMLPQHLGIG